MDHVVDASPVGESAEVAVVDEEVGLDFAGVVSVSLLRVGDGFVHVGGIEIHAPLMTPVEGLLEQRALADAPQDELVALLDERAERLNGEGDLLADLR